MIYTSKDRKTRKVFTALDWLADASQPLKKTVDRLLVLNDNYGTSSIIYALRKALKHKLYGFSYVQNIVYQEMTPITQNQPVALKNDELNKIRLPSPTLLNMMPLPYKGEKMDDVIDKFTALRLKNCALNLADVIDQGIQKNLSALQTIDRLLEIELACREKARVALRFKQSKLEKKQPLINLTFPIINPEKEKIIEY
ncbi:MAG: hypothetical protein L3J69_08485 [Desulfobacula sp.]|nr:hypothetical protein [Desulfobacula sp.]